MASPVKDAKTVHVARGFSQVVERGKGKILSKKPGVEQYAITAQVGGRGWHFGNGPFDASHEIDTAWIVGDPVLDAPWRRKMVLADYNAYAGADDALNFNAGQIIRYVHPGSGEDVTFQPMQLQWSNDLDQISPIEDPQLVGATIADDTLTWTDAYGAGLDFRWQAQTARLFKSLDIQSLAAIGAPPQFIIDGGNPYLKLEMIFQKSGVVDILVDGIVWDEKGSNPQLTATSIEFQLASTQETLWYFRHPLAWDTVETIFPLMHVRKSGTDLLVQIRTPWSWLQSASYPVIVDVTIDEQVAASGDDGMWWEDTPSINTNGVQLVMGLTPGGELWNSYVRFPGITISGTVDTAYVDIKARNTLSTTALLLISAVDADDPAAPTTYNEAENATRTTTQIAHSAASWTVDTWYLGTNDTVELKTIVQELVDERIYSNDAMIFYIEDDANVSSGDGRTAYTYDDVTANASKFHAEYTAGGEEGRMFLLNHMLNNGSVLGAR